MATIDHIILKANDLEASVKFYTEVLGSFRKEWTVHSLCSGLAPTVSFN